MSTHLLPREHVADTHRPVALAAPVLQTGWIIVGVVVVVVVTVYRYPGRRMQLPAQSRMQSQMHVGASTRAGRYSVSAGRLGFRFVRIEERVGRPFAEAFAAATRAVLLRHF